MIRLVISTSASSRLAAAARFLADRPPAAECVIVGASRGAADDLAREASRRAGATFGIARFSLTELAARAAAIELAANRRVPTSRGSAEAVAARASFDAVAAGELEYFAPVAPLPGFPRALARTVHELRLAGVDSTALSGLDTASADLGRLLARVEDELDRAGADDRASLFRRAAAGVRSPLFRWGRMPMVWLDVPLDAAAERAFALALAQTVPMVLATVPDGDPTADVLAAAGGVIERAEDNAPGGSDLAHLRRFVFTADQPPVRSRAGDVTLFSAPGEAREAVEIARRMLDEAARGVRFDEMAVLLRAPQPYLGLLEHAAARAAVPMYFERGVRRPDPAGRAFFALLSCAVEGLSARRFDEYLSLGQVPQLSAPVATPMSRDEPVRGLFDQEPDAESPETIAVDGDDGLDSDDDAVVAGTLRAPWKWEELIVESAVVGGRTRGDGKRRWRRRLDGLAADYRLRIGELARDEPESPRIARYTRDLRNLIHLRSFALPIIDELADWPDRDSWRTWIDRFTGLAERALARPSRVLAALAELRPMGEVGPVGLEEARDVLHDRLVTLDWDPPARRYGRVFVGTPHQARGRRFRIVFVPGLAERVVPQRPREDPLLLDERRERIGAGLVRQDDRSAAERLLLKISIGTAEERVYLSYPRLDVSETRARVPSFYALDVMRAITGSVPDYRVLAAEAADEAGARLAWPAPRDAARAIDDLEHDLATLKPLLDVTDARTVKGQAHYLLLLNDALHRSVKSRWLRARSAWTTADGLVRAAPAIQRALDRQRLANRPYSLSALQRFAVCPYQFALATIYRFEPWEQPEPLVRMDPLTRGSLFHRAQAEFYRAMQRAGRLPVSSASLADASTTLDEVVDRVAAEYEETLVPAIERVWRDEIDEIRRDLSIWVQRIAEEPTWQPEFFEFSFGLGAGGPREHSESSSGAARASGGGAPRALEIDDGRDPRSLPDPVLVDGRFVLRGSVDLIERRVADDVLRVTDHKTGKNRSNPDLIVGGGSVLQPVLYSLAVEQALGKKVDTGRLFYCTTAGGYADHKIELTGYARAQGLQALTIVDRAIELGFLAAAPAERACTWCDFRAVCGPREEERVARKAQDRLADLDALRAMR